MSVASAYREKGFTLVEITIVMLVIGLLLGGFIKMAGVQREQTRRDETRQMHETIKQAITGFAATYGRLPCPDTDGDGLENRGPVVPNPCTADEGWLPGVDIGVSNLDAWGTTFRYGVTANFADQPALGLLSSFAMNALGDISIVDRNANQVANNIPVVIVSYANNGKRTVNNIACPVGIPSNLEDENCNGDKTFMHDTYLVGYDDIISWIPASILKAAMLDSRLLP